MEMTGGLSNFFSQLIVSFGYTAEESLLYGTPGGAVEVVFLIVCGWAGDKYGYRILISMTGLCTAMLGMILIVALPLSNNSGRLAGYYLTQASPTPFVALLSLISSNVAGYTKKTTVAAMFLIGYCVGNIIGTFYPIPSHLPNYFPSLSEKCLANAKLGPQTFRPTDAPRYVPAEITIIVCWGVCLGILAFIHLYCVRQNKKKAEIRAAPEYVKLENQE
jgi:ACS family allantoate permease-like MFS transporter